MKAKDQVGCARSSSKVMCMEARDMANGKEKMTTRDGEKRDT